MGKKIIRMELVALGGICEEEKVHRGGPSLWGLPLLLRNLLGQTEGLEKPRLLGRSAPVLAF